MSYEYKLANIVRRVGRLTFAKQLSWSIDDGDDERVRTKINEFDVDLYFEDTIDGPDMVLEIKRGNITVEKIRDTNLRNVLLGVVGYSGWYPYMSDIFTSARRQADGTEKQVDKFLDTLTSMLGDEN